MQHRENTETSLQNNHLPMVMYRSVIPQYHYALMGIQRLLEIMQFWPYYIYKKYSTGVISPRKKIKQNKILLHLCLVMASRCSSGSQTGHLAVSELDVTTALAEM